MSNENLERARQGYEALNRGEVDRFVAEFAHPDYEFRTGVQVPTSSLSVRDSALGVDGFATWKQALAAAGLTA